MDLEVNPMPIVCDMSTAPDTGPQRLAEYDRLFSTHLLGRERRADGIRFRLRADHGVEAWVRDLAAREKACCAFLDFQIVVEHSQVAGWDLDFSTPAQNATKDLMPYLPSGRQVVLKGFGHSTTFWKEQVPAGTRLGPFEVAR